MKKLDKLILGSFLGPFLLTFIVVDFILLTVNMLKYFDEIFGKGLSFWIYMELIGYFVISISPMALPLAVLLSSLMTFGNLGEHFELTAIKSSGISLLRALRPIGVFVIVLSFAAYLSNNYLVPKVNLKTFSLLYDIRMKSPALDIKAGVFYDGIPGYSIKVNDKVGEYGLKDILIYSHAGGESANLDVTLADSGSMEPFFSENYMKLTLYNGINYHEDRPSRGINTKPPEFKRTSFDMNEIVFDLNNTFKLNRTAEDAWSTNRSIKNISQIKLGLDSIGSLVNEQRFQNYREAESVYSFFTRDRKFKPAADIAERKFLDDSMRTLKMKREKALVDSLEQLKKLAQRDTASVLIDNPESKKLTSNDSLIATGTAVNVSNRIPENDSLFLSPMNKKKAANTSATLGTNQINLPKMAVKVPRTAPLTDKEREQIDSLVTSRGYATNSVTMALNNSRNLKNTFGVKKTQIDNYEREYRRYQIAWYQKYTQAFACFAMFLIGAPLGAIIKKGGLGMPVLVSIIFFIVYYMLTITGEKWAKEGIADPLFGTWFSNLCLLPFGLFFVRQARKDARLFEPDFYISFWKTVQKGFKVLVSKAH
ncbi:LptF/LptG family permease [Algoriphagus persicinus]|uniref:LptF/LptG family permease n=1 Tax=Algoriphagus persicinus TaxID=3108754 RepID=UPI002B3683C3|nr:LptF/LptG family permease [Algoriphagus sp. E1-3-M2]MEB2785531.1 LptF/LptG family permease [Algoriphagus sp. E1-3-M2]